MEKEPLLIKKLLEFENAMYSFKLKQTFYQKHAKSDYPSLGDKTPDYDWQKLTDQFVEEVKKKTDNNDYAVDNNYYNYLLKRSLCIVERFQ